MAETIKCPKCETPNTAGTKYCIHCSELIPGWEAARQGMSPASGPSAISSAPSSTPKDDPTSGIEAEYLQSIDRSLKTIKAVAVWFLVLSILGILIGILDVAFR